MTRFLAVLLLTICFAQAQGTVDVVADLLNDFASARVRDTLSTEVRRPSSASGVKQDALFEHPLDGSKPARVEYDLSLPEVRDGNALVFAFDIAIADGIKQGTGEDGVRFRVEVDGRVLFDQSTVELRWQSFALDLTEFAKSKVRLALLTDAVGNTAYDWAVWGNPRVLHFRGSRIARWPATGRGPIGAVALRGSSARLRLRPDVGEPLEIAYRSHSNGWLVRDFAFPEAESVRVERLEGDAEVMLGAYTPRLRIARFAPARAVYSAGESAMLNATVVNEGRGKLRRGLAETSVSIGGKTLAPKLAPALRPGEEWNPSWDLPAPDWTGQSQASLELKLQGLRLTADTYLEVARADLTRFTTIENGSIRLDFAEQPDGVGFAYVFARHPEGWVRAATWKPLFGLHTPVVRRAAYHEPRALVVTRVDARTVRLRTKQYELDASLEVVLDAQRPFARIRYEWSSFRGQPLLSLVGPNLYVGDGTTGAAKTGGLFPGLEYLLAGERSSNPRDFSPNLADRRSPDPAKITLPFMAVTVGPGGRTAPVEAGRFFTPDALLDMAYLPGAGPETTVALAWNMAGTNAPSARFSSPNLDEGMDNHRLGLFLPGFGPALPENAAVATSPWKLSHGLTNTLEATLIARPGGSLAAFGDRLRDLGGLPAPEPAPRTVQEEFDLCRKGFLETVWDERGSQWRHCIGWGSSDAPGFAALLWLDALVATNQAGANASRERVERVAAKMLAGGGAGSFMSQAACHIMQWEFPFYFGHLAEAMPAAGQLVQSIVGAQQPNGGWLYDPRNEEQSSLGRAGDSVLGTCANRASTVLRYARITGDAPAWAAGEKALQFLENFRVPRGGQTWECPMYEPDILAAAYAIRANLDGYRISGNKRWLRNAVYWAETGVPFIYLRSLPGKPMMLGAVIPVFGSTFYTHSWLAMPVQWCGLVYTYHLWHLIQELERTSLAGVESPMPLELGFSTADWRRIVELVTVSAMHQQFPDGDKVGSYPDSITNFEQRNPAFINPEDILVNVLALHGTDPDIKSMRADGIVVSSGARVEGLKRAGETVRFALRWFPGQTGQVLVAGFQPESVQVGGKVLDRLGAPPQRQPGWFWDDKTSRAYLCIPMPGESIEVELRAAR